MENNLLNASFDDQIKKHSQFVDIWKRFKKRKVAFIGLIVVILLILMAALAPVIAPYDPDAIDFANRLAPLSKEHLLGTDNFGRDILTRIIYGGRTSLLVSLLGCAISTVIGGMIGAVSGYYGGKVDTVIMRFLDILMAIPGMLLAVTISAALGTGIWQTAMAISIGGIAHTARLMRGTVFTIRQQEFIEAAGAYGSKSSRIIFKHLVPNCLAPIIVDTTLRLGTNILLISSMSFVGLGVQPPIAEWGSMLNAGRQFIRDYHPICLFPGLAIVITMLGFNLFGDGLRDALDPKLKN